MRSFAKLLWTFVAINYKNDRGPITANTDHKIIPNDAELLNLSSTLWIEPAK